MRKIALVFLLVFLFSLPTCIWRPRWGWPRSNFGKIYVVRKLDFLGYHVVLFCMIQCLAVLIQYRRVTHEQTERRADTRAARAAYA